MKKIDEAIKDFYNAQKNAICHIGPIDKSIRIKYIKYFKAVEKLKTFKNHPKAPKELKEYFESLENWEKDPNRWAGIFDKKKKSSFREKYYDAYNRLVKYGKNI